MPLRNRPVSALWHIAEGKVIHKRPILLKLPRIGLGRRGLAAPVCLTKAAGYKDIQHVSSPSADVSSARPSETRARPAK